MKLRVECPHGVKVELDGAPEPSLTADDARRFVRALLLGCPSCHADGWQALEPDDLFLVRA